MICFNHDQKLELGVNELKGYQRRYLKGLAHRLKPVVDIGHKGMTAAVLRSIDAALEAHELIKVKFIDEKEKTRKRQCLQMAASRSGSHIVGLIGHTGILYRPCSDPTKQAIRLPIKKSHQSS